ncbi:hypothetical protein [Spirillospora sp. NPDC047279]|uniref:hypothetical protein n=1 Tax=Spirillospora sp. NPDC047279 TaxID=3155478 RepID=UPI0033D8533B
MDLESELRQAMAEHTAEASAPPSLAARVRHRHRRRQRRNRTALGIAAVAVTAIAAVPSYKSFQAEPVSSVGPSASGGAATPSPPGTAAQPPVPGPAPSSRSAGPGTGPSHRPSGPGKPGDHGLPLPPGKAPRLPAWVTYLPSGLTADGPCGTERGAHDTTTTCRWRGPSGSVEVRVIRGSGFTGPESLASFPAVPAPAAVRGQRAIMGDRPDAGRQIAWLDRPGVGVLVIVGGAARDRLLRIAEGVRP